MKMFILDWRYDYKVLKYLDIRGDTICLAVNGGGGGGERGKGIILGKD
jgi:hypothetical protein